MAASCDSEAQAYPLGFGGCCEVLGSNSQRRGFVSIIELPDNRIYAKTCVQKFLQEATSVKSQASSLSALRPQEPIAPIVLAGYLRLLLMPDDPRNLLLCGQWQAFDGIGIPDLDSIGIMISGAKGQSSM